MKQIMSKINLIMLVSFIVLFSVNTFAQSNHNTDEKDFMNFWIGSWEITWQNADGSSGKGIDIVKKILNGEVIHEDFKITSGKLKGFAGMSLSAYSKENNLWHQTWVDNKGTYLDFVSKMENDKKIFFRYFVNSNHQEIIQRIVFYNIKKDNFDCDWVVSNNEGKSWQLKWKIHYQRYKGY